MERVEHTTQGELEQLPSTGGHCIDFERERAIHTISRCLRTAPEEYLFTLAELIGRHYDNEWLKNDVTEEVTYEPAG